MAKTQGDAEEERGKGWGCRAAVRAKVGLAELEPIKSSGKGSCVAPLIIPRAKANAEHRKELLMLVYLYCVFCSVTS